MHRIIHQVLEVTSRQPVVHRDQATVCNHSDNYYGDLICVEVAHFARQSEETDQEVV